MRNIQQVYNFVKAHGHTVRLGRDSKGTFVELWIPWNDERGNSGQDYHRVETVQQAKQALGY